MAFDAAAAEIAFDVGASDVAAGTVAAGAIDAGAAGGVLAGAGDATFAGLATGVGADTFGTAIGAGAAGAAAGGATAGGINFGGGAGFNTGVNAGDLGGGATATPSFSGSFTGADNFGSAIGAGGGGVVPTTSSFLPVTGQGGASGIGTLDQTTLAQFGAQPDASGLNFGGADPASFSGASPGTGIDPNAVDLSGTGISDSSAPAAGTGGGNGFTDQLSKAGNSVSNWAGKNPAQAAMLGLSGFEALSKPALPGAAKTALGAAGPAVQQAQATISSGGTNTPIWQTQKSSIDTSIDQQLTQAIEQLKQTAASSGMGGNDSAVVQQKIAQLTQQANTQRQQMYEQAMQQNVTNAVAELSGGNQTLGSIAQMQLSQSEEARQAAAQTAELTLLLGSKGP